MVYNFIRKKLRQRHFLVSFPKFLKRPILENISERMFERNEPKNLCLIYSQENNSKDGLFSAVADMWVYSFSKRDSIADAFLWKLKFYRKSFLQNTAVRLLLISRNIFNLSLVLSAINQFIHS